MVPKQQVDQIITSLQDLSQGLSGLADLDEALKRAKVDMDSMNETRDRARAEMKEAQNLLTTAQINAQKQFEQDMFNKQGQLSSLTERVAALEERAKELRDEVDSKGAQLLSINNSMNEARRKLAG